MPIFPYFAERIKQIPGSVFEKYRSRMESETIRLHIGDSFSAPVYEMPVHKDFLAAFEGFHRYCDTFGLPELRKVLRYKVSEANGLKCDMDSVLVTAGATNALSAAVKTLTNPGEEILMLTPCWPLFPGIVRAADAGFIDVSFYLKAGANHISDIRNYLETFITDKTVAIYLNSPNNPSGIVLNSNQLDQIGEFAEQNDLWILSDEAYDFLTYDGLDHISVASRRNFWQRTISIFTFSKIFTFAGLRLGYALAEKEIIKNMNKIMVHQLYSPSTISQQMMIEPVKTMAEWVPLVQQNFQHLRDLAMEILDIEIKSPQGTYFLFFDATPFLGKNSYSEIIDKCFKNGVSVAPGSDFGKGCENYIRLCFSGEPEQKIKEGFKKVSGILKG